MTNKQIIYIPGRNPKPEIHIYRQVILKILVEGVRRVDADVAKALQDNPEQFHLVGWNWNYYHDIKDIGQDIPWVEKLINTYGPSKGDVRNIHSIRAWLKRFLMVTADMMPLLISLLPREVRDTTKDISRYFENTDEIGSEVRELLKQMLRPMFNNNDDILLIGHSLGSVIAYDTLWEMTHMEGIKNKLDFMTIGSPLGMHYMRRRLLGMKNGQKHTYPENIRNWINLAAEGDIAALNRNLNHCFHPMIKHGLVNKIHDYYKGTYNFYTGKKGYSPHHIYGYMVNPVLGSVIANWWENIPNEAWQVELGFRENLIKEFATINEQA